MNGRKRSLALLLTAVLALALSVSAAAQTAEQTDAPVEDGWSNTEVEDLTGLGLEPALDDTGETKPTPDAEAAFEQTESLERETGMEQNTGEAEPPEAPAWETPSGETAEDAAPPDASATGLTEQSAVRTEAPSDDVANRAEPVSGVVKALIAACAVALCAWIASAISRHRAGNGTKDRSAVRNTNQK